MFVCISTPGFSIAPSDTTWNETDVSGRKQGYWKKYYPNGELMYRGFFVNDKPSGKMQRFYDDGKLKAELEFSRNAETAYTIMYWRNGKAGAEGKYTGQKRDSIWNYYSYYTGTLSFRESYILGKRDGPSTKYYPEGSVAEVLHWKDDLKHGAWKQFFEDSTMRLSSQYKMDQLNGHYRVYNRDKVLLIDGSYKQGKMEGDWKFYDKDGKLNRLLEYSSGEILNKADQEKWAKEFMDEVDKNLGTIPEPDFENFFERTP